MACCNSDVGATAAWSARVKHKRRDGVVARLRAMASSWKQNQRELGEEHRGAMQAKPVRTAVWMKDKVEAGVHSVKDRFSMEAQQPDVETEV